MKVRIRPYAGLSPGPEYIDLDVSLEETHTATFDVTKLPVESGATVSDHVAAQPRTVQIKAFISEFPEKIGEQLERFGANVQETIESALDFVGLLDGPVTRARSRASDILILLNQWADRRDLVRLTTDLRVYEQMVIASVSAPLNPANGGSVEVELTLQEIRFASTRRTQALRERRADVPPAQPRVNRGKVATKPVETPRDFSTAVGIGRFFGLTK